MKRISLTDHSGNWFDADAADYYEEKTSHDGRNFISRATGGQWNHEGLYLTASGKWILNSWSNYQGSKETYEEITPEDAARWFSKQSFQEDEIPESLKEIIDDFQI